MATLATLRTQLQTRLDTITGLRCYDVWPDQIHLPAAIVIPGSKDLGAMSSSKRLWQFRVLILAAEFDRGYARGQEALDPYLDSSGSLSIEAAVEGDKSLGGNADWAVVIDDNSEYGQKIVNDIKYWGKELAVQVYA